MIEEEISGHGFECIGEITYDNRKHLVQYQLEDRDDFIKSQRCVYMWVQSHTGPSRGSEIVYIGRSASNVYHRRSQWQAGMNAGHRARLRENQLQGDVAGRGKLREMRRKVFYSITAGNRITVWARISARQVLFGRNTSMSAAEEEALIAIYAPPWNGYIVTY